MSLMLPWLLCAMAELSPSPDVQPIPVTGVVVDAAGRALRDAEIWLTRARRPEEDRRSGTELSWSGVYAENEESIQVALARSDAQGRFRVEVPAMIAARPDPVVLAVWAVHDDSAVGVKRLPTVLKADDPPLRLGVGRAARIELTITDRDGRPVANARVAPSRIM